MSLKALIGTLILVIIILGGWYYFASRGAIWGAMTDQSSGAVSEQYYAPPQSAQTGSISNGTSDADLNADLDAIDAQLDVTANSSASADTFNDRPIEQTE